MWSEEEIEARFNALNLPADRQWDNLKLSNDFLFGKVMRTKKACTEMMRRIFPNEKIEGIKFVSLQKAVKSGLDSRGVRFDMYIEAENRKVYDVEIQTTDSPGLAKRTRAYHLAMGNDLLEQKKKYMELPEAFVIFICTFDPFGKGRYVYTFRNFCAEDKTIALDDGGTTVFLNAYGNDEAVNPELKALLDFVVGRTCGDPYIKYLERRMNIARQNANWRREYMIANIRESDVRYDEHVKAFAEGVAEGKYYQQLDTARSMIEWGFDENTIHALLKLPVDEIRRLNT